MAIFAEIAARLDRVQWNGMDLQVLVDELRAGFLSKQPVVIDSGLKVSDPNSGQPPLNITTNFNNAGDNVGPISITNGGTRVPTVPPIPGTTPFTPPSSGGGGNAYVGVVVGGSGTSYTCDLSGPTGPVGAASVSVPGLASDATIPAGAVFGVVKVGSAFFGLPAIFLDFP